MKHYGKINSVNEYLMIKRSAYDSLITKADIKK